MKISILGAGSWGTALANVLAGKGEEAWLWSRSKEVAADVNERRANSRYLPGQALSPALRAETDLTRVLSDTACVVLAVPCQHLGLFLREHRRLFPAGIGVVCASKGVELGTFRTMGQVVNEELAGLGPRYAVLSGPSFASEVVAGMPTAVALGCADQTLADLAQGLFSTENFRVYVNSDVVGVELGGAVKNIMAIASGISDGLGFGENARAALITRGLSEMSRLGAAMGARPATFMGLSGMGDLVLTCTGDLSRNRRVGLAIGRGQTLDEVLAGMHNVAEGVKTAQAVHALGVKRGIELPITAQVHAVLFEGKSPAAAVRELMTRPLRGE
ncbi:MAG: NAD(P)-dependent glycerol-3-phosphate dehydrogenase [Desulfomicrobium sp.]|nr:NAD(P)-dependent glycerol-3-phosphate dehydrogenase [Desulfomicrobium sp.]